MNPNVPKIRELNALNKLRTGVERDDIRHDYRDGSRWGSKNATFLLNDYDAVVQALFAEQSNKTFENHSKARAGTLGQPEPTKLEILATK